MTGFTEVKNDQGNPSAYGDWILNEVKDGRFARHKKCCQVIHPHRKESRNLKTEPTYRADPRYLEESTFMAIVWMLERLPNLKPRIKKYIDTFPTRMEQPATDSVERRK